ncbi:hypothetical protein [Desulfosporosinus nitroreducens]|uniref:hypothetical protein n=1 Tax=Desulfosporosinus nitroreducens TaxID=2018668 RepID=UPI00207D419C|nr:hypothetical protein [Desulfosporosinus nitroreducens]MCO1601548.1 hypothetical protein [Desulfosporosinus nitroreducens]
MYCGALQKGILVGLLGSECGRLVERRFSGWVAVEAPLHVMLLGRAVSVRVSTLRR